MLKDTFAYIDKNGIAHCYRIESSELKEIPYEDPDNSGLTAVEFSLEGNGAGFGVREDGSVILLSGSEGNYNYTKAMPYLEDIEDVALYDRRHCLLLRRKGEFASLADIRHLAVPDIDSPEDLIDALGSGNMCWKMSGMEARHSFTLKSMWYIAS